MGREWNGWNLLNVGGEWGCGLYNRGGREKGGMGWAPPSYNRSHCVLDVNYGRWAGRKREGWELLKPPPYNRSHCVLDVNYER